MGVDFEKCSICESIRITNKIFCLDGMLYELQEAIKHPKVIKYLFSQEGKNLNKKEAKELIKNFKGCCHLFCIDCVDNTSFFKIDCFEEKTQYDNSEYLLCCYNFILALQKLKCYECQEKQKKQTMNADLGVIIHNLKSFQTEIKPCVKKLFLTKLDERIEEIIKKMEKVALMF